MLRRFSAPLATAVRPDFEPYPDPPDVRQRLALQRQLGAANGSPPRIAKEWEPRRIQIVSRRVVIPLTKIGVPHQVAMQNVHRLKLMVNNTTGNAMAVAFDPDDSDGIQVKSGAVYEENPGTIAINAIYVIASGLFQSSPHIVVYEGFALPDVRDHG